MLIVDLLFAGIVALLFALLLVGLLGWRHPRHEGAGAAVLFLFLLLLAVVWAGGVWFAPYGPTWESMRWLPFVIIGLFTALLILALSWPIDRRAVRRPPPPGPGSEAPAVEEEAATTSLAVIFTVFFWILLVVAVGVIIVRYAM